MMGLGIGGVDIISRVLYRLHGDSHSSRPAIAHWLKQPTRFLTRAAQCGSLFGLAPGGVYLATHCYQTSGALLPHPFTLTCAYFPTPKNKRRLSHRRFSLCCTCRGLAPPRRYLAPCSMEPGLSSPPSVSRRTSMKQRLPSQLRGGL